MKLSYLWSWPLAVISLLLGLHMLFDIIPTQNEYNAAVKSAEIIKNDSTKIKAGINVNYSYKNYPEMGSQFGADVFYRTPNGPQAAWIALEEPMGIYQPIEILYNENIPNFALNAEYQVLPHEVPDENKWKISLALIIIPLLYLLLEVALVIRSKIRKTPQKAKKLKVNSGATFGALGGMAYALSGIFFSFLTFTSYMEANDRVASVREEGKVIFTQLSDDCSNRVGAECDNRYLSYYKIDGESYKRLFQVKGDIINDAELKGISEYITDTSVPLIYNEDDPRFAYSLSSSEQVEPPYNTFELVASSALFMMSLLIFITSLRQQRYEGL